MKKKKKKYPRPKYYKQTPRELEEAVERNIYLATLYRAKLSPHLHKRGYSDGY